MMGVMEVDLFLFVVDVHLILGMVLLRELRAETLSEHISRATKTDDW